MNILVTYASKHGATREIAERIAETLARSGHHVDSIPVRAVNEISGYGAVVIGSAVYLGSWLKEATAFVHRHHDELSQLPIWLFSSGPIGTETVNAQGQDVRVASEPKQLPELKEETSPRDHHVFFGAIDPTTFGFTERVIRALPAGKELLKEGDWRDWAEIEDWAIGIADSLATTTMASD